MNIRSADISALVLELKKIIYYVHISKHSKNGLKIFAPNDTDMHKFVKFNMEKFQGVSDAIAQEQVSRSDDGKQAEGTLSTVGESEKIYFSDDGDSTAGGTLSYLKSHLCMLAMATEIYKKNKKRRNSKLLNGESESPETTPQFQREFMQSDENNVPIFVHKSIEFIEEEGLDSVGIYRIPGNIADVRFMFDKFLEDFLSTDPNVDIKSLNISVNAVATALKFFFSKMFPPLFNKQVLAELEKIKEPPNISSDLRTEVNIQRTLNLKALRQLLDKLPLDNVAILKFLFQHFVRVSEHSTKNNMESKNIAICWWPTLIQTNFTDMTNFEQLRPHFEDIVQNMIDKFPYFFPEDISSHL